MTNLEPVGTPSAGKRLLQTFPVAVPIVNCNDPVTDLRPTTLSPLDNVKDHTISVTEENTVVATLHPVDQDTGDQHVVVLFSDPSGLFVLTPACATKQVQSNGCQLVLKPNAVLDFETNPGPFTVTLQVTDATGATKSVPFVINVLNRPLSLILSNTEVNEFSSSANTANAEVVVGTITMDGFDQPDKYTSSVTLTSESPVFSVRPTATPKVFQLYAPLHSKLNFIEAPQHVLSFQGALTVKPGVTAPVVAPVSRNNVVIKVLHVNKPPVLDWSAIQQPFPLAYHAAKNSVIVTLPAVDVDSPTDISSWTVTVPAVPSGLTGMFAVSNSGVLSLAKSSTKALADATFSLTFVVTDKSGASTTKDFVIHIITACHGSLKACGNVAGTSCAVNFDFGTFQCSCPAGFNAVVANTACDVGDNENLAKELANNPDGSKASSAATMGPLIGGLIAGIVVVALVFLVLVVKHRRNRLTAQQAKNAAALAAHAAAADAAAAARNARLASLSALPVGNPMYNISATSWYDPAASKEDTYATLASLQVGSFSVRDLDAGYMLHVRTERCVEDVYIQKTDTVLYMEIQPKEQFTSLSNMVKHYCEHKMAPHLPLLCMSNPMYDLPAIHAQRFVENDYDAPAVPLKERERAQLASLASDDSEVLEDGLYLNRTEASQALGYQTQKAQVAHGIEYDA